MTFTDYAAIIGCSTMAGGSLMLARWIANELLSLREYRRLARALNLEREDA